MNTIFKRSFFAVASLFSIFLVCSSCEDNIGINVTDEAPNADKTLYEVIMNDPELTDFVEVLNACNVRSKKRPDEIISVADSLFNTSRVYTVWAPKNGFNKDSILQRIKAGYREDVMKTFVFSHVANYLKAAKGKYDEKGEYILLLNDKKLIFAGSYDKGYTWTNEKDSGLGGPCARFCIRRLKSGRMLLINHHDFIGRNNLKAMVSEDEGATWMGFLLLDERTPVTYPDMTEDDDGNIYVTYDFGRYEEREILMAKITEADILAGEIVTPSSYLKRVVNRATGEKPGY